MLRIASGVYKGRSHRMTSGVANGLATVSYLPQSPWALKIDSWGLRNP